MDEGLRAGGAGDLGTALGATFHPVARPGSELGGDFGRYTPGRGADGSRTHQIYFDKSLPPENAERVQAHEVSHMLDDRTVGDTRDDGP